MPKNSTSTTFGANIKQFLGIADPDILGSPVNNQIAMALAIKLKEIRVEELKLVSNGIVDLVKKLRPNIRGQKEVLYVENGLELTFKMALKRN